jgi:hypothetical protein
MTDAQIDMALLQELAEAYRGADPDMAEANVAEVFVARLFEALGWDVRDPLVWNRQSYVRGAGYADAALQIDHKPVLFVEVKRFEGVAQRQEEVTVRQTMYGEEPILSQAEREALSIDRTPEEKQAMRYARGAGIRWAVLTNFERLLVFDADEERVVLAFDAPEAYLERLDDLELLAPADTPEQFHSRLQWYADLQKKPEIDKDFYRFLSEWRLRLAQAIYDHNHGPDSPLRDADGEIDLDRLRQAVQRTLDRLIIIRYADDVGFLKQHDLLENELVSFLNRQAYTVEYEFQESNVNRLYRAFYRHHDTTIFAPDQICERVRIPNETLVALVREISAISFRKFTSDILGNTYESYLGQRLVLEDDTVEAESDQALRKEGGIYYTPSYIVRYIVDHTLGRWLYGTPDGQPPSSEEEGRDGGKTLADLEGLQLADPAMGSGSFLIYAFEVLADFYERENERIRQENTARWDDWGKQAMEEGMFGKENDAPELEEPVPDYVSRVLQEHLYGVDLDPEAVEIAGVNLILRAFDRLRSEGEERKLPLILGQNLKVGNSLISGVSEPEDLAPFEEERRRLITLREELAALEGDEARAEKQEEIASVAAPVNAALNASLEAHFDDVAAKRPFNWEIAFPEVFDPDLAEEEQGFTVVVGNPPYVFGELIPDDQKPYLESHYEVARGQYDVYWLFYELCLTLVKQNGYHGYIVPDALTVRDEVALVRKRLLKQGTLNRIASVGAVFPDPAVSAVVTIWQKSLQQPQEVTVDHIRDSELNWTDYVEQEVFAEDEGYRFSILIPPAMRSAFTRMTNNSVDFSEHIEISRGEELGKKDLHCMDFSLPTGHVPILVGQNVNRYGYPSPTYSIEEQQVRKSDAIYRCTKILVVKTGDRIVTTLDSEGRYTLQSLYNLLPDDTQLDLRFLLGVIASRPVEVYFRKTFTEYKDLFPQINQSQLEQIPIPLIDCADPADVTAHDAIAELAQRMLDLNKTHQAVTDAFAEAVRGYERTSVSLQDFLGEQSELIRRHALLDANEEGEVSSIAVEEDQEHGGGLLIRAEVDGVWRDVARLAVDDEDLHLYLLLALRVFLHEHRRKYVWSRGKVLNGILEALSFPCLDLASPERNQRRAARLLQEVRSLLPDTLPHHDTGLDREGAPLHLSAIEATLDATDEEIDRRVYALYGLTEEEIAVVEGRSTLDGGSRR